jgi:hypothetical protein
MSINFPNSPSNGQQITSSGKTYTYNSSKAAWKANLAAGFDSGQVVNILNQNAIDSAVVNSVVSNSAEVLDSSQVVSLISTNSNKVYTVATMAALGAVTGMATGDQALVTSTNKLFMYNSTGWYIIATITNGSPSAISNVDSSYTLATDGTAIVVNAVATDPEGATLTWSSSTSGLGTSATIAQGTGDSSNYFTVTPSTNDSDAGTFTLTIAATDGVNGAVNFPASFTLAFSPTWSSHSLNQSLQSSATSENAFFGDNLEIDGNYAVIGARGHGPSYTGKAFIFYNNSGTWAQQQELTISDGSTTNFYGQNVSISGDTAAVSATGGNGSCYIFTRSGTTWTQQTKLSAPTASSGFGQEISLVGDKLVVGMWSYDSGGNTNIGRLVSYTRSGTTWSSASTIDLSDGEANDMLGYNSLRISEDGNYLIVGVINRASSGTNTYDGVAYIFNWTGSAWSQQAKLEPSDGAAYFYFGNSVAITDKYAAVASLYKTSETGAVYVWTRSGTTWTQRIILGAGGTIPSDLSTGDQFGFGLDIHKNSMVVAAANRASPKGNGHVYVFTTSDDGVTWTQRKKFTTPSGDIHDNYGQDSKGVGIDETSETIVVGAGSDDSGNTAAGKIYIYSS